MILNPALVFAVLVGMILLPGCLQDTDSMGVPESTVPATISATPSVPPTVTHPPPDSAASGPVQFVPGRVYHEGDELLITGTTILSPKNPLLVDIMSVPFGPTNKTDPAYFSGATAVIEVQAGSPGGQNTWHYLLNTSGFAPGDYSVEISGLEVQGFQETATFTLEP